MPQFEKNANFLKKLSQNETGYSINKLFKQILVFGYSTTHYSVANVCIFYISVYTLVGSVKP